MGQIFNFFPLSVLKSKIHLSEDQKKKMLDEIFAMEKESKNEEYKNKSSAWTGDTQGFEYIHNNPAFEDFFIEVKKVIIEYLEAIEVDSKQLNIFVQRSWATISNEKENIALHKHLQSHLSFAYYLKKIQSDANLLFIDETKHNEFLPGLFLSPTSNKKQIIKKRNISNSAAIVFEAQENDIVVFPSKTSHQTQPNIKNNNRVSISADIFITAKDTENLENLVTPFENWKSI
ncbi:hypothetical protein IDH21_01675 [Pelagibacterales bacterium SAG-MED47]|nr:hypothetical protein [Pelagibacterales bacterium SAG-MED47]